MKHITAEGFFAADWIRRNGILHRSVRTVRGGGITIDGVRFVFFDPHDTYPDGTEVVVSIFYRRLRNSCQTIEEYEIQERIIDERMRRAEQEDEECVEAGTGEPDDEHEPA
jgi:hypothetical protein